jgi:hypothetical protein
LKPEHFDVKPEFELGAAEKKSIVQRSIDNEDLLVGYQIELYSSSTKLPKGIWVIMGTKRFRFSSTQYLLRNKVGEEKWRVLEKEGVAGKPFVLKRRVAKFI